MTEIMSHSVFLWPVTLCALLSVGIVLERFWFLFFRASLSADAFMHAVETRVNAGDVDGAVQACLAQPASPLAGVVKAALVNADAVREDLALAVEQATLEAIPGVQRRVAYLATLANVVTLIGLLGTIVGLITSFDAVSKADVETKQTMLAAGIATAMYATAGGIGVAIPTLGFYAVLVQKGNAILDDVERCGARIQLILLARRRHAVADAAPEASST